MQGMLTISPPVLDASILQAAFHRSREEFADNTPEPLTDLRGSVTEPRP